MATCPIHGELKISKGGKPYCMDENGNFCNAWRPKTQPQQGGWSKVREGVAAKVAPEKERMTREDWEAKEQRTNRNILLQVAFKAAVEWLSTRSAGTDEVEKLTLSWYNWLLLMTDGAKASHNAISGQFKRTTPPADLVEQANRAVEDYQAENNEDTSDMPNF